jgi:hypothetical protein
VHDSPNFPDISLLESTSQDDEHTQRFNTLVRSAMVRGLEGEARLVMPRLYVF